MIAAKAGRHEVAKRQQSKN